ncbi:CRE-NHR-166 protein [Caenorhabditis remanei]|uniref:CRE-NHR-166 protein n=1 Tax=Caenorhabditis remanei TaxID=31234 RepID=E3NEK9_CAERE|nr:CRE-NHR-166 protein [Caenorhabditis remanei]
MCPDRPNVCAVCHQKAYGYNYEVVSCNACKMFFRRAINEKVDDVCKRKRNCFADEKDLYTTRPKCRACRFNKCLALGMRQHSKSTESSDEFSSSPSPQVSVLVVVQKPIVTQAHVDSRVFLSLRYMNQVRRDVYRIISVCEDPSFLDLVAQDSNLERYRQPKEIKWESTERKLKPWGSLGVLLIVEVVKTMEFYQQLLLSDRVILLKNVAFKSHHLSIAFDSYVEKKGRVIAPTGDEMFPKVLFDIPNCRAIIMDLLTTPMQPLMELNLTENEFLLLNMIVICNPALGGLSLRGQDIIGKLQKHYTRILLNICMIEDPRHGPTRFTEILAINQRLQRQSDLTSDVVQALRSDWEPRFHFSRILIEACKEEEPYIKEISAQAKETLYRYQCHYTQLLLQQCLQTDPRNGPARLLGLLRVVAHLNKQIWKTKQLFFVMKEFWNPDYLIPKESLACHLVLNLCLLITNNSTPGYCSKFAYRTIQYQDTIDLQHLWQSVNE